MLDHKQKWQHPSAQQIKWHTEVYAMEHLLHLLSRLFWALWAPSWESYTPMRCIRPGSQLPLLPNCVKGWRESLGKWLSIGKLWKSDRFWVFLWINWDLKFSHSQNAASLIEDIPWQTTTGFICSFVFLIPKCVIHWIVPHWAFLVPISVVLQFSFPFDDKSSICFVESQLYLSFVLPFSYVYQPLNALSPIFPTHCLWTWDEEGLFFVE